MIDFTDNLAFKKPASQSSTWNDWVASRAVDGRYDTLAGTLSRDVHPWWAVDLGAPYAVSYVNVLNDHKPQWGNCR